MTGYVSKEDACKEIARFKGYLDDDMIYRLQLAINRLPNAQVIDGLYDSFNQEMMEMEGQK